MKQVLAGLRVAGCLASFPALAGALVDLAATASQPAVNDLVRASVYSEVSGKNPAELAQRVNAGESLVTTNVSGQIELAD